MKLMKVKMNLIFNKMIKNNKNNKNQLNLEQTKLFHNFSAEIINVYKILLK